MECHPPPLFTTDQDARTRGRYLDVGTPPALPLRLEQQELGPGGFAPPSLVPGESYPFNRTFLFISYDGMRS